MKRLVSFVVGVLVLVGILLGSKNVEANQNRKLIIGFDDTFAPFGFRDEKGDYVGFDLDLAKEVLGSLGYEYEFQPIDWATKETELNTGNIDMIWNGYTVTEERKKVVDFSDAYISNRQIILVKEGSNIQTKADLEGKVVATQAESSSLDSINKDKSLVQSIDGGEPVTYSSFVEVFADLDNGRADAIVVDERLATYYLSQSDKAGQYRVLKENLGEEEYAIGFRKEDKALQEEVNKALAQVLSQGKLKDIEAKWFADLKE